MDDLCHWQSEPRGHLSYRNDFCNNSQSFIMIYQTLLVPPPMSAGNPRPPPFLKTGT